MLYMTSRWAIRPPSAARAARLSRKAPSIAAISVPRKAKPGWLAVQSAAKAGKGEAGGGGLKGSPKERSRVNAFSVAPRNLVPLRWLAMVTSNGRSMRSQ